VPTIERCGVLPKEQKASSPARKFCIKFAANGAQEIFRRPSIAAGQAAVNFNGHGKLLGSKKTFEHFSISLA
jgi:hypothetical protein